MFKSKTTEHLIALETQLKLMREDNERLKATLQTLTKHVKFLVYSVKAVNPELNAPEE